VRAAAHLDQSPLALVTAGNWSNIFKKNSAPATKINKKQCITDKRFIIANVLKPYPLKTFSE